MIQGDGRTCCGGASGVKVSDFLRLIIGAICQRPMAANSTIRRATLMAPVWSERQMRTTAPRKQQAATITVVSHSDIGLPMINRAFGLARATA